MRLTEDQIVDLIGHPDKLVRQTALDYFTQAFKDHPRLFAAVKDAAEKYGGDELIAYWEWFAQLTLPEDQIPWLVQQSTVDDSAFSDACRYLLFAQDIRALARHQALWIDNADLGIGDDTGEWLKLRLALIGATAADAWAALQGWARERAKAKDDQEFENSWMADAWTEVVQREGRAEFSERVREIVLEGEADPTTANFYLMPFAIRLAGAWKLEDTAAAIFQYDLEARNDLSSQEIGPALAKIGGDAAVRALTHEWPNWDQGRRTLAALYLAYQRGPVAIETAIALAGELAPQPDAGDILNLLGDCVLVHFDQDAGERLIAALGTDEAITPCAKSLITWADALKFEHPQRQDWVRLVAKRHVELLSREHHACGPGCDHDHGHEHEHHHYHEHDACGPGCDHDHEHHHHHADDELEGVVESDADDDSLTVRRDQTRVGRNDPCPCGSGKKYKKCCLLKVGSTAGIDFDF